MEHDCKYEEDIGYIKASLDNIQKQLNGSMKTIGNHINESDTYRNLIISHDVKIKMIVGFFISVNLAVVGALVRLFIK